jgi:hypothetical protein
MCEYTPDHERVFGLRSSMVPDWQLKHTRMGGGRVIYRKEVDFTTISYNFEGVVVVETNWDKRVLRRIGCERARVCYGWSPGNDLGD